MRKRIINLVAAGTVCMLCLMACDLFEYHPYSTHIDGKTGVHALYIPQIERECKSKDVIRLAFVTDTQGSYNELEDAIRHIRQRGDIDFIIHGGDQSDFGLPKEFMWCRDVMEKSHLPYVAVIGNHDCLGNGEHTFEYVYGQPNFSFNAGYVHFLCLNTVALEYDYSNPVPDLTFIENDISDVERINAENDSITHTVVVMHSRPYDDQFNNNVAKVFDYYLSLYPGATADDEVFQDDDPSAYKRGTHKRALCINGHNHRDDIADIFGSNMLYYGCANMGSRAYYVFTINREGYEYEKVDY